MRLFVIAALLAAVASPILFGWEDSYQCATCTQWQRTRDDQLNKCATGGVPEWHQTWAVTCFGVSRSKDSVGFGSCPKGPLACPNGSVTCWPVMKDPTVRLIGSGCEWEQEVVNRRHSSVTCNGCVNNGSNFFRVTSSTCPACPTCPNPQCEEEECGNGFWDPEACVCNGNETPILVSLRGNRLQLTDAAGGVLFDLDADGTAEQTAWTVGGQDDAFLVLDRNHNGLIDNGSELFGDASPQHDSENPNGFHALAFHDEADQGGNGDGWIDSADLVFSGLALWIDSNHDGISQPSELRPVWQSGIRGFDLDYRESRRTDRHGNQFKYIAPIQMDPAYRGPRRKFAIDVIFVQSAEGLEAGS